MITIELLDMRFYAHHGCFEEEQEIGTYFSVDVSMESPCSLVSVQSDRLEDTINYQTVYDAVKEEMMQSSHLLEHVAGRIVNRLKNDFPQSKAVKVCISKLSPSLGGQVGASKVTLTKE